MLQETIAIAWKDLISEFRVKYIINSMIIFSLMVIIIFNFIFYNTDFEIEIIISAVLWVTVIFSGTIGLSRSFINETNNNCLDGLLLCPVERSSIYLGKIISNLIFIFLIEFISLVIIIILFNYDISSKLIVLLPVIIIGTIGFVIVGALLSAIAVYSKGKEVILPIILFPILIPLILLAVSATKNVLLNGDIMLISNELRFIGVYDIIFFIVAFFTFEYILED